MQPGTQLFDISLNSGNSATREALAQVLERLSPLDLDPEELSTVELVLAEALNNIVEHAYPEDGPGGPIKIACERHSDGLHFALLDHGLAMPNDHVPLGEIAEFSEEIADLPEGGFGWFLIRDLAKDIAYQREADQNQLSLRIAVAHAAAV